MSEGDLMLDVGSLVEYCRDPHGPPGSCAVEPVEGEEGQER